MCLEHLQHHSAVVGAEDAAVNKMDKSLVLVEFTF